LKGKSKFFADIIGGVFVRTMKFQIVTTLAKIYNGNLMQNISKKLRLGILLSGGGRTMVNLARGIERGELPAEIVMVVSSRSTIAGVDRARELGLDPRIIRTRDYPDSDEFSLKIVAAMDAAKVDLILQCGWLCFWKLPERYANRVMNIHPALLPAFGGRGMWGHHVHEAVLKGGCKISGCSVHFVTNEYDAGPIIVQRPCPVLEGDDADTLAARVFEQECLAYPEAIGLFAQDRLEVRDGIVHIRQG
jgi:phosphoribosylglycinamide formyltransferase 1